MVVGDGMISNIFRNKYEYDNNYLIFSSGVSNSNETNVENYKREEDLILKYINDFPSYKFIYFSSVLLDIDSPYFKHKKNIERIIINNCESYLIFRLPQILGNGGNRNNIINYFRDCISNNIIIKYQQDTYRSIIDIDDLYKIVNFCIKESNIILNISYIERIYIKDLICMMSEIMNRNVLSTNIETGHSLDIENSEIINIAINNLKIEKSNYTEKILRKYL
jgi:hypothetical protein